MSGNKMALDALMACPFCGKSNTLVIGNPSAGSAPGAAHRRAGAEPREASASGNLLYDTRKNT